MTFSRYYPSGTSDGVVLPAACVNQLDQNQSRALDAYGGGTYSTNGSALIRVQTPTQFDECTATFSAYADDITIIGSAATHVDDFGRGYLTGTVAQTSVVGSGSASWPIPLSPAATITAYTVYAEGAAGHGGEIQYRPSVVLRSHNIATGVSASESSVTDPELVAGNYESLHTFGATGLSVSCGTAGVGLSIYILGESGTNAAIDFTVYGIRVYYTVTTYARI